MGDGVDEPGSGWMIIPWGPAGTPHDAASPPQRYNWHRSRCEHALVFSSLRNGRHMEYVILDQSELPTIDGARVTSVPFGVKENFETPRLIFLLAGLVELGHLLLEGLRHRVLLPGMAAQSHEREEAVRLSVFRFAVGKAGKPPKPYPVRRAGVSVVPLGPCLRGKGLRWWPRTSTGSSSASSRLESLTLNPYGSGRCRHSDDLKLRK